MPARIADRSFRQLHGAHVALVENDGCSAGDALIGEHKLRLAITYPHHGMFAHHASCPADEASYVQLSRHVDDARSANADGRCVGDCPDVHALPGNSDGFDCAGRGAYADVTRLDVDRAPGRGASLLDGYMEDLATDRIYRLMIAQRVRHRDLVRIVDENGQPVLHSPEFITDLFDEELNRILRELPTGTPATTAAQFKQARAMSEQMIVAGEFNPK